MPKARQTPTTKLAIAPPGTYYHKKGTESCRDEFAKLGETTFIYVKTMKSNEARAVFPQLKEEIPESGPIFVSYDGIGDVVYLTPSLEQAHFHALELNRIVVQRH